MKTIMNTLNGAAFTIDDLKLYLDTHPDDAQAATLFEKMLQVQNEALTQCARRNRPMTIDTIENTENWPWISTPWPWEKRGGDV